MASQNNNLRLLAVMITVIALLGGSYAFSLSLHWRGDEQREADYKSVCDQLADLSRDVTEIRVTMAWLQGHLRDGQSAKLGDEHPYAR